MTPAQRNKIRKQQEDAKRQKKEKRTGEPVPPKKKHSKNTNKR